MAIAEVRKGVRNGAGGTHAGSTSEALLDIDQACLEAIPAAVYLCSCDGQITRFNRRAVELWGRAPALGGGDWFCGAWRLYDLQGKPLPKDATPMGIARTAPDAWRWCRSSTAHHKIHKQIKLLMCFSEPGLPHGQRQGQLSVDFRIERAQYRSAQRPGMRVPEPPLAKSKLRRAPT